MFDFCPHSLVPETLPPEPVKGTSLNGWFFSSRPTVPYQKTFKVTLHGLRWYLNADGTYDATTDAEHNARRLELFYEAHGVWDNFAWAHPHLGPVQVRFKEPVQVPKGISMSGGIISSFEILLVEHNPGWT